MSKNQRPVPSQSTNTDQQTSAIDVITAVAQPSNKDVIPDFLEKRSRLRVTDATTKESMVNLHMQGRKFLRLDELPKVCVWVVLGGALLRVT